MKATSRGVNRPHGPSPDARRVVRLQYIDPLAKTVFLAGTFNDWHPSVTEMIKVGDDRWAKELALPPGTYEYRLVVDGRWMSDPSCAVSSPNPYGEQNSVLTVAAEGVGARAGVAS